LLEITGCKIPTNAERPEMSKIVGCGGTSDYSIDGGTTWRSVKLGKVLPLGSLIRTAEGDTNGVMLSVADKIRGDSLHTRRANLLTIYGNALLKLEKVTSQSLGGKKIGDIRLSLLKGNAIGHAWNILPGDVLPTSYAGRKLETIKKQPNQNYYEIRTGNVVLHMQHAYYFIGAAGKIWLFQGFAALEFTDTGATKDLFGGQFYDPISGTVISRQTEMTMVPTISEPETSPDWHYLTPAPNFKKIPPDTLSRPF
jgi:hypothetical protein